MLRRTPLVVAALQHEQARTAPPLPHQDQPQRVLGRPGEGGQGGGVMAARRQGEREAGGHRRRHGRGERRQREPGQRARRAEQDGAGPGRGRGGQGRGAALARQGRR